MPENHPQLMMVEHLMAEVELLLGVALANKEIDLVISYAAVLSALRQTGSILQYKSGFYGPPLKVDYRGEDK